MSKKVARTRNAGRWTEAAYNSFIKSGLRRMSQRWGPISDCLKGARVGRGKYKCACCKKVVPVSYKDGGKRKKNIFVDHILPVVPTTGFDSWDGVIGRMFCEADNLQLLCKECHDKKTAEERKERGVNAKRD